MDDPWNAENINSPLSTLADVVRVKTVDVFQFRTATHQVRQCGVVDFLRHPAVDFALGEINYSPESEVKINSLFDFLAKTFHLEDILKWQIIEDTADDFQRQLSKKVIRL